MAQDILGREIEEGDLISVGGYNNEINLAVVTNKESVNGNVVFKILYYIKEIGGLREWHRPTMEQLKEKELIGKSRLVFAWNGWRSPYRTKETIVILLKKYMK